MFRDFDLDDGDDAPALLGSSHPVRCRASVWRGATYFGTAPVVDGELTEAADQFVTGTGTLTVAPYDLTGTSWVPREPEDALNVYGSRVHLSYDVGRADGTWLGCSLGWFVIDEWELSSDGVDVTLLDLRDVLRTARLLGPSSPRPAATFASELRQLVGGRLALDLTNAPADRSVPSGMAWQESRTDAIDELLKAWPARAELDGDGVLTIVPDTLDTDPAQATLVDGVGGTVVSRSESGSRDGLYNVVVARGETTEAASPPITGYAADNVETSPTAVDGPMGELVTFFSSPLLTTEAQATKAARTILTRSLRRARQVPVTTIPDPRLGVNARVDLPQPNDEPTLRTVVLTSKLPLTADGGSQSLTLGVIDSA